MSVGVTSGVTAQLGGPLRRPISLERLGKKERSATPYRFAEYLISLVDPVSVLWVNRPTVYRWFGLDLWDISRDANQYVGPGPIIAHPPCGPWGKYWYRSSEDRVHGINAMRFVHAYGGVVEQPNGSELFGEYGRENGRLIRVNQFDFGHRALKPTLLYVYK